VRPAADGLAASWAHHELKVYECIPCNYRSDDPCLLATQLALKRLQVCELPLSRHQVALKCGQVCREIFHLVAKNHISCIFADCSSSHLSFGVLKLIGCPATAVKCNPYCFYALEFRSGEDSLGDRRLAT